MAYELIPLEKNGEGEPTVNARAIHAFLDVQVRYDKWIARRIATYGFQEGRDFTTVTNGQGPVRTIEYHVTLAMAKELSMVERTKRGKEARQYFLECEKQLQARSSDLIALPAPPTIRDLVDAEAMLTRLGQLGARDKLLLADALRTTLARHPGLLIASTDQPMQARGFDIADALDALAPHLSTAQRRSLVISVGRRVATEYRERYRREPEKNMRYVDGKNRAVNWYQADDTDWVYPIIQSFLVGLIPWS